MRIGIYIPDKDIPQRQDSIDIHMSFIDGKACECNYPFIQLKTGRWIKDFKNSVTCSCCNQQFHWEDYNYDRKEWIVAHNYCPNCGAEMESEGQHDRIRA